MTTELFAYAADEFGLPGTQDKGNESDPVLFVAPLGNEVPDDGVFQYTTINNLSDIGAVGERSVILFREQQSAALKVLCSNMEEFGRRIQPLFGVPNSIYEVWFDDAAFGTDRVAYGAFVAELRASAELEAQRKASTRSGTDNERERFSKASGAVRFNTEIGVAGDDSDVDQ